MIRGMCSKWRGSAKAGRARVAPRCNASKMAAAVLLRFVVPYHKDGEAEELSARVREQTTSDKVTL